MTSKLINKLIVLLSSIILLFVVLFSLCFGFLFVQHAKNVENTRLETKALTLADTFSKSTPDGSLIALYNTTVLRLINTVNQGEVWLIDKNTLQISGVRSSSSLRYEQLPTLATDDIQKIFAGENIRSSSFNKFINPDFTTVGVPVYDRYGQIQAALLLHDKVPTLKHSWYDGIAIMLFCVIILYIICIFLLIRFVKKYVLSLGVINSFAQKIVNHNYDSRIKTKSSDEIGQLAQNLNNLSEYLQSMEETTQSKEKSNYNLITKTAYKLHTPLKELKSNIDSLKYRSRIYTADKKSTDTIQKMIEDVEKLQHITNNLLNLSQINESDFNVHKDLINLLEILKDSISASQKYASYKNIYLKLNISLEKEIILFTGDTSRLKQMFCETLDKAIQIYPVKSILHINVTEDNSSYFINFSNSNNELSSKSLPEFFQQASDNAVSTDDTLLSSIEINIATHLAKLHDIELSYEKVGDDYTNFKFTITK